MMLLLMRAMISSTTVSSWPVDGLVWAISQGAPRNIANRRTANLFIQYLIRRAYTREVSPGIKIAYSLAVILPRLAGLCWAEIGLREPDAAHATAASATVVSSYGVNSNTMPWP